MKKKFLFMFLILQLLLIITNYFNIDSTLLTFQLYDILKVFVIIFGIMYILFISKLSKKYKISILAIILILSLSILFGDKSIISLINNLYYITTYSFFISYYDEKSISKNIVIKISTLLLFILEIYLLFTNSHSFTFELIVNVLIPISLFYFNTDKVQSLLIIVISLLLAYFNQMYLIVYNLIVISLIMLLYSLYKKQDRIITLIVTLTNIITACLLNLFSITTVYDSFFKFDLNFNISFLITVFPLIILFVLILYGVTKVKKISLELILNTYLIMRITSFAFLSLKNIENELIIIIYSYMIVIQIKAIALYNKQRKKDKIDSIRLLCLHLGYGGIETSTINTANTLSNKYNVEIISFYNLKNNQAYELNDKINVKYLYDGGPNGNEFKEAVKNKNICLILKEGIKAVSILLKKHYLIIKEIENCSEDVIVSTRWEFSVLLSKYGNPSQIKIAQEHHYHNNNKKYINILKRKYYNIDYLFALTNTLKKDYEKFLVNNKHTKIVLIPNMIISDFAEKSNLKNKNIISVGRLHKGKKIDDLIKIFSKVKYKDSKLFIIGDGEEFKELEKLIKNLKLEDRVLLLGYKTHDEIKKYMLKSSIFAMTSITEGLPMVLLEAMSYGLPCIAYQTDSGVSDIIDNETNGYVINKRNEKEYTSKLIEYLKNNDIKEKMSENAIKKAKKFSQNNVLKMWVNVLENND